VTAWITREWRHFATRTPRTCAMVFSSFRLAEICPNVLLWWINFYVTKSPGILFPS
jgi:hypothetical protein